MQNKNRLIVLLLILCILLSSCGATRKTGGNDVADQTDGIEEYTEPDNEVKEVAVEFVNNNSFADLGISDSLNEAVKQYFTRCYKALGSFENVSLEDLFYFDTDYQRGLSEAIISYQNSVRRDMNVDMGFSSCKVGVTYTSLEEHNGDVVVKLLENNSMNYNFIPDVTSYTCDIEHVFRLHESNGSYYIVEHSEISGVYSLLTETFDKYVSENKYTLSAMTQGQIYELFEVVYANLTETTNLKLDSVVAQRDEFNANPDKYALALKADNEYNREAAVAYSYEWAGTDAALRNPNYTAYDIYGGNCNNYTSQCLFASGIPMDYSGNEIWKWHGETISTNGTAFGRSYSWTVCENFYGYCKNNTGRGLVAEVDGNLYSGREGDIIQYVSGDRRVHSVIISKVIYDQEGNVVDYLINSNTMDKRDCPMTAYGYSDFYLIRIAGWNN